MKDYLAIERIEALEVLDSRGNPTIQVEVETENGTVGIAVVPSGASTGSFEAVELRDHDEKRFMGKGVMTAISNVNKKIAKKLEGENVYDQICIDKLLIELDGTPNKSRLGANAILGVSLGVARAAANSLGLSLYQYLGGISGQVLPIPFMNILNGGKHASNNLSIQEFMIVPLSSTSFQKRLQIGVEIYHTLKNILWKKGYMIGVGDEGGFAPNLENEEAAIENIIEAIKKAGYKPGEEVGIALDVASSEMQEEAKLLGKDGYYFWKTKVYRTREEMVEYLVELTQKYPIISIEDGLAEEDWTGWRELTKKLGKTVQLVGDDLFVTNPERLKKGIKQKVANSILIKPNQIGTLTETLDAIHIAKEAGYRIMISHRSGETEDTSIADIAVATNAGQIKTGAPCRSERVAKYNRLLNIEHEIRRGIEEY